MQSDSLNVNNHYTSPAFARKGSEFSSHNSTAIDFDPSGTNKNTQGIKVTTDFMDNSLTENKNPNHDDWDEHDPSLFAHRVLKKGGSMLESISRLNTKNRAKTHMPSDKILFEKLEKIQQARLTKTTSQRHAKDPKSQIIRYQLEDFDEELDEDRINLTSLVFKALEPSSTLEINPVYEVSTSQEENKNEDEHQHGFSDDAPLGSEVKNLSQLKHKLIDIKLLNDKGGYSALGKIEYKRWKHRAYNVQKKLLYKIIKGDVHDEKSQTLYISNEKGKKVGTILITHINSKVAKCEIDFPKDCDSKKKLILISILFAILDHLEPYDETSFFRKIINKAFFGLSCTN